MSRHLVLAAHLRAEDVERRYRTAKGTVERTWWQIVWLVSQGQTWAALRDAFSKLAMRGAPELPDADRELVRASRYSGYRRLLDRMATGLLTTEQAMDTDPGAVLATYIAYMTRIAGRIRRQQKLRVKHWEQHQAEQRRIGKPLAITPDLSRGMGARLDALERTKKRAQLLEMALGVFDAGGVVRLQLHREADVSSVSDLLVYSLDELEAMAKAKGGIRRLLDEKWTKVYKASASRGLFSLREKRAA